MVGFSIEKLHGDRKIRRTAAPMTRRKSLNPLQGNSLWPIVRRPPPLMPFRRLWSGRAARFRGTSNRLQRDRATQVEAL